MIDTDRHDGTPPTNSADQRRRDNVRPSSWKNPEPAARYQLVVIGAGTAGLVSAAIAAGLGARVALIERDDMGGDCLNTGCVPSKAIIRAARAWHDARASAGRFGGPACEEPGNFAGAMRFMRNVRADISTTDSARRFRDMGIDLFFGQAEFDSRESIIVRTLNGEPARLVFRRSIIASGAQPAVPPIDGLAETGYLTSENVFDLETLPPRLLVIGGGPIGCELAQAFARLGSSVTLLNADERLLRFDDADAAKIVENALTTDGVVIHHRVKIKSASKDHQTRALDFETDNHVAMVEGDCILVATGRAPRVAGFGLEAAGVRFTEKGIGVDDRFRSSNSRIFAIGDCASRYQFTHAADAAARMAVPNALFFGIGGGKASDLIMPWCTFTTPAVAHTGITAAEVSKRTDITTLTIPLDEVDRSRLEAAPAGFLRVHLAGKSDRILGATVVSEHAGETISEITSAIVNGIGLSRLGKTIRPYPTDAEVIRKASDQYRRGKLSPGAKRIFELFFRLTGRR